MAISTAPHWFDQDRSNVMSAGSMPHQPGFEGHSSSYGGMHGHPSASHYGQHSELSDPRMTRVMDSSSSTTSSPYAASAHPHPMADPNSPMAGNATFPFLSSHGMAGGHASTGSPSMASSSSYRHSITSLPATIDCNYYHQRQSSMGSVSSVQDINGDHGKYAHPSAQQHAAFSGARNWPWTGPAAPSSVAASRQGSLSSQGGYEHAPSTAHSRTPSYVYAYPSSVASTTSTATSARGLPPSMDPSVPLSHHVPEAYPMSQRPVSTGTGTTRRAKFKRSRTGCLVCRKRKVKCSQDGQPCKQCRIGKRDCHYEENPPKRKRRTKAEQEAEAARQREVERAADVQSRVPGASLTSLHMTNPAASGATVPSSNGVAPSSQQWRGNGQPASWMPESEYGHPMNGGNQNGHSGSGWYGGDSHSANAYSYDRGHASSAGAGSYGGLGVVADAALNAQPMPSRGGYHRSDAGPGSYN